MINDEDVVTGRLDLSLLIECPACEGYNDLFEDETLTDDGFIYKELLSDDHFGTSEELFETICKHCGYEFKVDVPYW